MLYAEDVPTPLGLAQVWTGTRIGAGDVGPSEIDPRLQNSAVAVLLVSKNLLASKFINGRECPQILKRAATGHRPPAVGVDPGRHQPRGLAITAR